MSSAVAVRNMLLQHNETWASSSASYGDRRRDRRMRIVGLDHDVLGAEIEDRCDLGIELQPGQRAGCTGELEARLFEMIFIEMRIAKGVHEIANVEAGDMR